MTLFRIQRVSSDLKSHKDAAAASMLIFIMMLLQFVKVESALAQSIPPDPWPQKPFIKDSIDSRSADSPIWTPTGTSNTVATYFKRSIPALPWKAASNDEVKNASNKSDAKNKMNATHAHTMRAGLRVYDGDAYDSGFYALTVDPLAGSADNAGFNSVSPGIEGKLLNTDLRAITYIANARAALNYPLTTHSWTIGYGSTRLLRVMAAGDVIVSMHAGTANECSTAKLALCAFNKQRTIGSIKLQCVAPPGISDTKVATLEIYALGIRVINTSVSNAKPFTKAFGKLPLLNGSEWFTGSFNVPFIDWLSAAVKINTENLDITPRISLGTSSASAEARLSSGVDAIASIPLYSLWGFASVSFDLNCNIFNGGVVGGNTIAVEWSSAGMPLLRDANYAKADYSIGALNGEVKAKIGFNFLGIFHWHKDQTLFSLFKTDGTSVSRTILSSTKDIALR